MEVPSGQVPTPTPVSGAPETPPPAAPTVPPGATPETPPTTPPETPPSSGEPKVYDEAYVKKLRDEAADWRTKYQGEKTKVETFERDKLTKEQQVEADLRKFQDEVVPEKDRTIRELQVQVAAQKLGVVDLEAAVKLLDWDKVNAGTSVEDALNALVTAKTYLVAQPPQAATPPVQTPPASTSPANPGNGSPAPQRFTLSQLKRMTPAEYLAQKTAIDYALEHDLVDKTQ